MTRIVTIPTSGVSNAMAAYTIGFARLEVHDRVDASSRWRTPPKLCCAVNHKSRDPTRTNLSASATAAASARTPEQARCRVC
jgi:hypothetical protein